MIFRTVVDPLNYPFTIDHRQPLFLVGSCFTENICKKLRLHGFATSDNPFGILYNPISLEQCIRSVVDHEFFEGRHLFFFQECWHSFAHHGKFSLSSQEECLRQINNAISEAHQFIQNTNICFITLGTAFVYRHLEKGWDMGNCHKLPSSHFEKRMLSVSETQTALNRMVDLLHQISPEMKVIFTVSPIRHWGDGYRGNLLSKSTLHLAIEKCLEEKENTFYFPAYEIMIDELRDYRFYEKDFLHPSELAIDYIWERFCSAFFDGYTIERSKQFKKLHDMKNHRPFNPESEAYKKHLNKIEALEQALYENTAPKTRN